MKSHTAWAQEALAEASGGPPWSVTPERTEVTVARAIRHAVADERERCAFLVRLHIRDKVEADAVASRIEDAATPDHFMWGVEQDDPMFFEPEKAT